MWGRAAGASVDVSGASGAGGIDVRLAEPQWEFPAGGAGTYEFGQEVSIAIQ